MKDKESKERWYYKIIKLFIMELKSEHGRVNLSGIIALAGFILLYTACDWVANLISSAEDTIKSVALKTDIYHPVSSPSILSVSSPILIGLGMCLLFIYFQEKRKDEIRLKEQELNK